MERTQFAKSQGLISGAGGPVKTDQPARESVLGYIIQTQDDNTHRLWSAVSRLSQLADRTMGTRPEERVDTKNPQDKPGDLVGRMQANCSEEQNAICMLEIQIARLEQL
jgi:hypothetical protein